MPSAPSILAVFCYPQSLGRVDWRMDRGRITLPADGPTRHLRVGY